MTHPDFIILFVENPITSSDFYQRLFQLDPVERSATFALFILPTGMRVGLWSRHTAEPRVAASAGAAEICFRLDNPPAVDTLYADWSGRGLTVLQTPVQMDFGYTFVVADPDGHRLRAYAMTGE